MNPALTHSAKRIPAEWVEFCIHIQRVVVSFYYYLKKKSYNLKLKQAFSKDSHFLKHKAVTDSIF